KGILKLIEILLPNDRVSKFIFGKVAPLEIAATINKRAYFSHETALYLHGLCKKSQDIYTNIEQTPKLTGTSTLTQESIDQAFSRPMRKTNQIAQFKIKEKNYRVHMLNGKHNGNIGVVYGEIGFHLTNLERTFIDCVVRPQYAGGPYVILEAFKKAHNSLNISQLLETLKKMNFKYPYHQVIGFYLERAGYDDSILQLVRQFDQINYCLSLDYMLDLSYFSSSWNVYYPAGFDR
ncbi:hypothetical protein NST48_31585, partial [Paenibacillus sp. FSL M7-0547]|uniref:type IV toxin-antitoxin system AbiEi family antitoxin domain-containing protein n=2 Tax=unclassified Paenibacillus TaxID=185978 RepID=UPI0030FB6DD4